MLFSVEVLGLVEMFKYASAVWDKERTQKAKEGKQSIADSEVTAFF